MKTLYFECAMGAAGDMLMAALLELVDEPKKFLEQINSLELEGVKVQATPAVKCGITGTHIKITINDQEEESIDIDSTHEHHHDNNHEPHEHTDSSFSSFPLAGKGRVRGQQHHHHTGIAEIKNTLSKLKVSQKVKDDASNIYNLIAQAESKVHGKPIDQIHFHEVGNMDAIADIVGVCLLMETIAPKEVIVSPIHVGSGHIHCAHGILPVPAPATALILKGLPILSGQVRGELCTPTGAAILKYFAARFGDMPQMCVEKIGYGMGKKDFELANCVRAFLGESQTAKESTNDTIAQLVCNLDDMTGEAIGFAVELLLKEGAKDVFTTPIQMKKNRPATLLTCICDESKADFFAKLILKHTTTFGVRKTICSRYTLDRKTSTVKTEFGDIRVKTGEGYGVKKSKPEYDDIVRAADENKVTFKEIIDRLRNG